MKSDPRTKMKTVSAEGQEVYLMAIKLLDEVYFNVAPSPHITYCSWLKHLYVFIFRFVVLGSQPRPRGILR